METCNFCALIGNQIPATAGKPFHSEEIVDTGRCDRFVAASQRLSQLARSLWATPPRTSADLRQRALIAMHCHRDAQTRRGKPERWSRPEDCDDWADEAIAHLIHAVLTFGEEPEHPCAEKGPDLATKIKIAMARDREASAATGNFLEGPAFDAADAIAERASAELRALEARLPNPPRTFDDVVLRAELAYHFADHNDDGRIAELDSDDVFEASAARLIEGVLHLAGVSHG